jgi:hypothetical protein
MIMAFGNIPYRILKNFGISANFSFSLFRVDVFGGF